VTVPRDLAQARHIELLERALEHVPQRRSGRTTLERTLGRMSRDQLIAFILRERDERARDEALAARSAFQRRAALHGDR
jgi:hypothetical protein